MKVKMTDHPQSKSHFTVNRPVAVLMLFSAAVLFGVFSFKRLPITLMPELTYPTLTVRTEYPGAAPEEVENDVSRPIEESLGVISGLNRISSISRAGVSDVVLEFLWGTDMSEASQKTMEKLDLVFLPKDAERPLILHYDPALDPIMELSFSGQGSRFSGEQGLRRLRRIAEYQVKRVLEPIKGVAAVRIRGGLEEEIHILLEEEKLQQTDMTIQQVINRLSQENINVAGGTIKEGHSEYMVRTLNEYEDLEQIRQTVVKNVGNKSIRVEDLGEVVRSNKDRELMTRTDGMESVQIDIYKEADANMVTVAKNVLSMLGSLPGQHEKEEQTKRVFGRRRNTTEGLKARLLREEGASLEVIANRSTFIENSINEVRNTAILGGGLAILILFLFLRSFKSTAIVAVSIPMSLLITFAPLHLFGVSLNIMSLGGLALGIGMLVDSSIVVLESIFRCQEEGDDLVTATIRGTKEVKGAVFSSTLTSIAVFFPMVFVEGIAGQTFGDLGMAVVVSLLASLAVALYFIPMLASRKPVAFSSSARGFANGNVLIQPFGSVNQIRGIFKKEKKWYALPIYFYYIARFMIHFALELAGRFFAAVFYALALLITKILAPIFLIVFKSVTWIFLQITTTIMDALNRAYPKTIKWALNHPGVLLLTMALCFFAIYKVGRSLDTELLPEVHQGEFTFEVSLPVGTPIEETSRILSSVEEDILNNKEDIRALIVTYGYDITNMKRSDEGEHTARFKILLAANRNQAQTEGRVLHRLRSIFADIPDAEVTVSRPVLFSSEKPIVLELHGDDLDDLKNASTQAGDLLKELKEVADVEVSLKKGAPEIQILYDRDRLMMYGLNVNQVATQVRDMVKGYEATRFNLKDRRVPMIVRLKESNRENIEDIGDFIVNPQDEYPIRLSSVAELKTGEGPSEIRRINSSRVALVNANIGEASLGSAVEKISEVMDSDMSWTRDMTYLISGQNQEWERSKGSLYLALFLSLFLVYVIMASQFESLLYPLVIMFTIPLAFFGTVLGLKWLGISLSIVVFLGMIMLAGIVVNNAIVLIDYVNILKQRGQDVRTALINAGKVRLRPILMTTATTVLGLIPMALGFGDGAEIRTPMAIAVIFGLITSTFLTLLFIPTIYYLVDRVRDKLFANTVNQAEVSE
ncbi:MAG: acriflavin resistance protein [Acidobacteria bacterium]|nr:MAG: acriflavin resistance protein [Acidobacteriota bacterium]